MICMTCCVSPVLAETALSHSLVSQAKLSCGSGKVEKLSASISKAKEINEESNTEDINDMSWKSRVVPGLDCCSKARSACDICLFKVLLDPKVLFEELSLWWMYGALGSFCRGNYGKDTPSHGDRMWEEDWCELLTHCLPILLEI